jgi:16S rRNA (cytosine967-C5)-methyltransferase
VSLDANAKRLERVQQNLSRTGLTVETVVADVLAWENEELFDAILLDAPCTATGTCRRHPDVLHRIGARQIEEMAQLQSALLTRAMKWLKPGGRLVYAVCSLEREEGEVQAAKVPLRTVPVPASALPQGIAATPEGWLRTDPGMLPEVGGLDGFFIACFQAAD